ncbi:S-methyl-5'-thioadenosine phosphorylase [Sphingomonas baiyangensis]|uniref:S-methyl-5'-thioadenosine phosphorylase n=1 Tax=Sphingomonas baiyangensis TaxID=2572576 RepID=A0A4U1L1L4_9SPHN|nr:S-methyl-5'-thioadenosine phosphorylase [Sphingomonas baiyangensis]TKD50023.1 S-methyl-5'-thioadenosine phosphorylase [Sphingomonas baiyangensis]
MGGWTIGVLGGSGLYAIDGIENGEWIAVDTPWGAPSDAIYHGRLGAAGVLFLPRHGRGHRIAPEAINARANIDALKQLGATDIVAISSVGSLVEERPPGSFTIVDQFIDRTRGRVSSYFGSGMVAHVSLAEPTCPRLSALMHEAAVAAGVQVDRGGTYLAMEGPQFSTRAESLLYRQWGCHVIGMTAMPEARLAREAELPYALMAMVTDYDCWREDEAAVDVTQVLARVAENGRAARAALVEMLRALPAERPLSPIDRCLHGALMTAPQQRDPALVARLQTVAGRALRGG